MCCAFSSSDAEEGLRKKIQRGIEKDYDTSDRTTKQLDWIEHFEQSIRDLKSRSNTPSMTEIEMVVAKESAEKADDVLMDTGVAWVYFINDLYMSAKVRSETQHNAKQIRDRARGSLSTINVPTINDNDYKLYMLKEHSNQMEDKRKVTGISNKDKLQIGASQLALENPTLFREGVIDSAKEVSKSVDEQKDRIMPMAKSEMFNMGQVIGKGIEKEQVYKDDLDKAVGIISSKCPDALRCLSEGIKSVGSGLHKAGIDVGVQSAEAGSGAGYGFMDMGE